MTIPAAPSVSGLRLAVRRAHAASGPRHARAVARALALRWKAAGPSLNVLFALLLAAALLPFLVYIGWAAQRSGDEQALANRARLLESARRYAARIDEEIGVAAALTGPVAHAAGPESAAFERSLDPLRALRAELPAAVENVAVWNANGDLMASLDPDLRRAGGNIAARDGFGRARRGQLAVDGPYASPLGSDAVVDVYRGATDAGGNAVGVVSASLRVAELRRLLDAQGHLPRGTVVTLAQASGRTLLRWPANGDATPDARTPVAGDAAANLGEGLFDADGQDGRPLSGAYAPLRRAALQVVVAVPAADLRAGAITQPDLVSPGVLLLFVALVLAGAAAQRIAQPFRDLARDAAAQAGAGRDRRATARGSAEARELARALDAIADRERDGLSAALAERDGLRRMADHAPLFLSSVAADGRITFINGFHRDAWGIAPEDLCGRALSDVLPAALYQRLRPHLDLLAAGVPASFELCPDDAEDGPRFLFNAYPDVDGEGRVLGFHAIGQDVAWQAADDAPVVARERFISMIADNVTGRITYLDPQGRILFGNRRFAEYWRVTPDAFLGRPLAEVIGAAAYAQVRPYIERCLAGEATRFELALPGPDGTHYDLLDYVPDRFSNGKVVGLFTISQDITELKRADSARAESERRVRVIADNMPAVMAYVDAAGRYRYANAAFTKSYGLPLAEVVGREAREVLGEDAWAQSQPHIAVARTGRQTRFQRARLHDGRVEHELVQYIPDLAADGSVAGLYVMIQNITDLKETQAQVEASEKRLRTITDNIPALICYIDRERRFKFNSRFYEAWLGRPVGEITGRRVGDVLPPKARAALIPHIERAFGGEQAAFDAEIDTPTGTRHLHGTFVPDVDADGRVIGVCGSATDITSIKAIEKELQRVARIDTLTGLPNRSQYEQRISEALARSRRAGTKVAVLFLDIDGFKSVNDSHGHAAGDHVLCEFGRRVAAVIRETDLVVRLAGDEFVVILEGVRSRDECGLVAAKIVNATRKPIRHGDAILKVTTSVGIALSAGADDTPDALLHRADGALYAAKAGGRDTFEFVA